MCFLCYTNFKVSVFSTSNIVVIGLSNAVRFLIPKIVISYHQLVIKKLSHRISSLSFDAVDILSDLNNNRSRVTLAVFDLIYLGYGGIERAITLTEEYRWWSLCPLDH